MQFDRNNSLSYSKLYLTKYLIITRTLSEHSNDIMFLFLAQEEGCRHCLPGWTYMNSMCYYFPFSEIILRRPWIEARQFCLKQGGDLAKIDSREKHVRILLSRSIFQVKQGRITSLQPQLVYKVSGLLLYVSWHSDGDN